MVPRVYVKSITFSDDNTIHFNNNDVIVIVGPNNSGKSATLRIINSKLTASGNESPVVKDINYVKLGELHDLISWLDTNAHKTLHQSAGIFMYGLFGAQVQSNTLGSVWTDSKDMHNLSRFFCHLINAEDRIKAANEGESFNAATAAPKGPLQRMYLDDVLESNINNIFSEAFGNDLILNRAAGSKITLHVGKKPIRNANEDRTSASYIKRLIKLPLIQSQGDGMRSFAGVLLNTMTGLESILLLDEPEAFLHPPQAHLLGNTVVMKKQKDTQLFIATHSGDVLRGILDAIQESQRLHRSNPEMPSCTVKVIRLNRVGSINSVSLLDNEDVSTLWNDPLLRSTNILDGLFHETVVVCEADTDARFYAAMTGAIFENENQKGKRPDIMFTHCGGKDRTPIVARAMRSLNVPTKVIVDLDILQTEGTLQKLTESCGGNWNDYKPLYNVVYSGIHNVAPPYSIDQAKRQMKTTIDELQSVEMLKHTKSELIKTIKDSSPWTALKIAGEHMIPSADAMNAYRQLNDKLRLLGIFMVSVGELERFCKAEGDHGPRWLNKVLLRDLAKDNELETARSFMKRVLVNE